jgi:hypothetical protein
MGRAYFLTFLLINLKPFFLCLEQAILALTICGSLLGGIAALALLIHVKKYRQGGLRATLSNWGRAIYITGNKFKIFPPPSARWY